MQQNLIQIGNSVGIIIPSSVRNQMKLKKGTRVYLDMATDKSSIVISKSNSQKTASSVTPNFIRILDGINHRYGPALSKLAKL